MKIFQLKSDKLVELKDAKEKGRYFDYEKTVHQLIEKNLNEIFAGLEFVKSEYQIDDLRIDSVAFDTEKKSFAIIEYKNVENTGLVDQGVAYYDLLQKHKADFVLLYNEITGKSLKLTDVEWDEIRVIFISPFFNKYQIRASNFQGLPIELYEIRKYEDNIITLNRIESKSELTVVSQSKIKSKEKKTVVITEYKEDDYLAGRYDTQIPTPEIKALYYKFKNTILSNFDKLESKQKKKYVGFYSKEDGSAVCTLEVRKHKIMITYSTTKKGIIQISDFVRDVSKIGHWGIGHFQSEIKNEEDVRKSLPLIQKVYEEKAGISFSSSKLNTIKILSGSSTSHGGKYLEPEILTIKVGEKVKWQNNDTAAHTITSGDQENGPGGHFDSSLFGPGKSFEVTFNEKGNFTYHCVVHPWKIGKIIVQ